MATYTVKQGDYLGKIARLHGFHDWRAIYDHPENADVRELRPSPNLLCPGDEIFIPDKQTKTVEVKIGMRHRFRVVRPSCELKLSVCGAYGGDKLKGSPYVLGVGDEVFEGTIPDSGVIEQTLPPDSETATLKVKPFPGSDTEYSWDLRIGHLDPLDTVSGIQGRLKNLGLFSGEVDGEEGPDTRHAVRCFQGSNDLACDGIAGPKTQGKLEEIYGC